ncbi:MAG TPA: pantoate--beta-alanine ligase [Xanthobacteraceae bacterium]|nr:pantoate--beta-alanine ligase [Xanthobacteraceae bacterium]
MARRSTIRPKIAKTVPALRRIVAGWRDKGETVALVPTMGALHAGHIALVRLARRRADRVVVSIFVNPAQFAPSEDFSTYPRTFDTDVAMLAEEKADLVWAPATVAVMYPDGFATRIVPEGPATADLEDRFRPDFFKGVATVVAKLFTQAAPDIAVFGEKDYQQLRVVTRMGRDLDLPLRVIGVPTVREKDGLAMSSRNVYLSPGERAAAPTLHRVLTLCANKIAEGHSIATILSEGREAITRGGFALDYLEARHAETLAPIASVKDGPVRLLVAAKLGKTRLIDNVGV